MGTNLDLNQLTRDYKENGFIHLRQFFGKNHVLEIERAVADFIKTDAPKLSGRDINLTNGHINSIHKLAVEGNYFWKLLRNSELISVVKALCEEDVIPTYAELFAKPAKVGLPSPMHQDNFYWCLSPPNGLTAWVALDHCDKTNGGLEYYKGSHKLGGVDHKDSFAPGSSQTVADQELLQRLEKDRVCITLEPGDVLMHHVNIIHGSAANTSERSRRGVTLQYKGVNAGIDKKMKEHYEARLYEQIRLRESQATNAGTRA